MKKMFAITGSPALKKAFAEEINVHLSSHLDMTNNFLVFNTASTGTMNTVSTKIPIFNLPEQWNEAVKFAKEKDWEEGMWVVCKTNGVVRRIAKLKTAHEGYDDDNQFICLYPDDYKIASESEIKYHLFNEAKKRGIIEGLPLHKLDTINLCGDKFKLWGGNFSHEESVYDSTNDTLSCCSVVIYKRGEWASVSTPTKKIAGMYFEKRGDKLYANDFIITKTQIEVIDKMLGLFFDYPAYCIKEVKIGCKTFTRKDIKTILELYYGKNQ